MRNKEKHVLVIFPHPDDESFGASGTISKFRSEGIPVTYLCGTLGEMGRNMGSPVFANRETLYTFRKKELQEASRKLDINVELLGYRDKTLEFEPLEELASHLKARILAWGGTTIITHYPGYGVHPDHDALGRAVVKAVEMIEPEARPEIWMHAISNGTEDQLGKPDFIFDVTPYWDKKEAAIRSHLSQADGMMKLIETQDKDSEHVQRLKTERFYRWTFTT